MGRWWGRGEGTGGAGTATNSNISSSSCSRFSSITSTSHQSRVHWVRREPGQHHGRCGQHPSGSPAGSGTSGSTNVAAGTSGAAGGGSGGPGGEGTDINGCLLRGAF
jgi:hypothetical protein